MPIHSPQFGRVLAVCVGAMMIGSIKTTVEEGEWVQRGQEFRHFAFGTLFPSSTSVNVFIYFHLVIHRWFNNCASL